MWVSNPASPVKSFLRVEYNREERISGKSASYSGDAKPRSVPVKKFKSNATPNREDAGEI